MSRPRTNSDKSASEAFKREVRARRAYLDMTQDELGETIGVCSSQISKLLANPDSISIGRLRKIIQVLDLDPQIILALVGYSQKEIKDFQCGSQ